ncbi:MAG: hypothetical protein AAF639_47185, partial [Chloroflexota bacterium]
MAHTPTPTPTHIPMSLTIDEYEHNDTCTQASIIQPDGTMQTHTFHAIADTDWTTFTAPTMGIYRIEVTIPNNAYADVDLFYYNDCDTFHKAQFVETYAPGARIDIMAEAGESFYIKVKHIDPLVYGPDMAYHLSVRKMPDETDEEGNNIIPGPAVVVAGRYRGQANPIM